MQPHIQMFSIKSKQISSVPKSEHIPTLLCNSNASINVKPRGGGGGDPGICGAYDFSEEFLVKIPTVEPQNWVKSDQISPPWGSNIP